LPGTVLGKYQIVQRLGSGGMGSVYEAIHRDISKPVALKTLAARLASEPAAQPRFLREANSASRLSHPHVVTVTDFGSDGGITYLVMELLRGEDLAAALVREPMGLPVERIADIMLAVCAGVFAAHEAGIIHRDLKPPNIFLSRGSLDDIVPKVLDFGISKALDEKMASTLTGTGTVIGTTPYLSPEQVAGRPVDARSDQYSLGVILYECVTGRRPHEGENLFAIMRSIADGRFLRPRELRSDVPPAFEAVIMRAMSHDPARRFESVHALGHALLAFASQRSQVLWGEYYGADRASRNNFAVMPRTQPLPELSYGVPSAVEPLDSTRTGGRRAPSDFVSQPVQVRSRSTGPLVFLIMVVLAGLGFAAYMVLRPEQHVISVQPPTPAPAPPRFSPPVTPTPAPPVVEQPPPPPPPSTAGTDKDSDEGVPRLTTGGGGKKPKTPRVRGGLPKQPKVVKEQKAETPTNKPQGPAPILD
jgi:serine/threonine protein kinase